MLDIKQVTIDGVEYEIFTGLDVKRSHGQIIITEKATGKQRAVWGEGEIPDGWEPEPTKDSRTREYILDEIMSLFDEHGKGAKRDDPSKPWHIEYIDSSEIGDDGFVITARREGKLIGAMDMHQVVGDGQGRWGKLNKAVVVKTERKTEKGIRPGAPVSENLMRAAIATLINESHCDHITTQPGTEQGRKLSERNGFSPDENSAGGYYKLSEKIIGKIKDLLGSKEAQFSEFPGLLEKMRPIFTEVVRESELQTGAEKHL